MEPSGNAPPCCSSSSSWLSSLDPLLQSDITDSITVTISAFDIFRATASLPSTVGDDLPSILLCIDELVALTQALGITSVACKWAPTADPIAPGRPSLRRKFLAIETSLVDADLSSDIPFDNPDAIRYCQEIIRLSAGQDTVPSIWHALFNFFAPQTTSVIQSPVLSGKPLTRLKNTPIKENSSSKLGVDESHRVVDRLLGEELDNLLYPNTPDFFKSYFPPQDEDFEKSRYLRDPDGRWTNWPDGAEQDNVLSWFFKTTDVLLGPQRTRQYYSSRYQIVAGSKARRKVDLYLYPKAEGKRKNDHQAQWPEMCVVGELKEAQGPNTSAELLVQLAGYVREIFGSQHTRRFVHAFTLTRQHLRCWVFHRGGGFGSERISINKEPRTFVNIMVGYGRMSLEELGFDPTLTFDHFQMSGCPDAFTINEKAIFWRKSIASRGTTCFDVTKVGDAEPLYVLKEAWRGFGHNSEVELLRKAKAAGVNGLTEYLAFEDVQIGGAVDDIRGNIMKGLVVDGSPMQLVFPNLAGVESPGFLSTFVAAVGGIPTQDSLVGRQCGRQDIPNVSDNDPMTPPISAPPAPSAPSASSAPTAMSVPLPAGVAEDTRGPAYRTRSHAASVPTRQAPKKRKSSTLLVSSTRKVAKTDTPLEFNRIHSRILMRKGREIYRCTSTQELLLGLHDALQGHRSLLAAGILHRDISIFNIMLSLHPPTRSDGKRGFLIDLDMAIETACLTPSTAPHRTGTREFMAIEVLNGDALTHTYRHDIESFFYVFVWICVYGHWWHNNRETPLRHWARGSMRSSGMCKLLNMRRGQPGGWQTVEWYFQPWANGLKKVAELWRSVLFKIVDADGNLYLGTPEDPDVLYKPVLQILRDGASGLSCS
ncbi:hypothetical protein Q9L58_010069 [Maublancomyces gigas]|uniref:Fungal-type protein kinase domain-containing protein n=1 Tax=Discina gigas TaxID=1032678 RepID=A0ABR3G549_9PEZI